MQQEHVRVVINRTDGGVSIMQFMTKTKMQADNHALDHWTAETVKIKDGEKEIETPTGWFTREASDENIADEIKRSNIDFVSFQIADDSELPTDRTFRNAWARCPVNKIKVDMDKARDIHMGRIRAARNERLVELDKRKYGSEYDAERQKLRDLPATFDLSKAQTPDELKALWPDELKQ